MQGVPGGSLRSTANSSAKKYPRENFGNIFPTLENAKKMRYLCNSMTDLRKI